MKSNFLFICVDQLRQDTLGCYGNDICQTPNLDKFSEKATLFTNAYTTCTLCSPARASIFTGLYAFKHGMGTNCDMYHSLSTELKDPTQLLHTKLIDEGYRCGYLGKWHVGSKLGPTDYGFEGMNVPGYGVVYLEEEGYLKYLSDNKYEYKIEDKVYFNPKEKTFSAGVWDGAEESTCEYYLAQRTIDMIKDYEKTDKPFFITTHFWGPHMPYLPPKSFVGKHDRKTIKEWESFSESLNNKPNFVKRLQENFYRNLPETWEDWQKIIGLYYDFVSFIDKQIGRILDTLKELDIADNTVIVFTTDHGDMQGSHNNSVDKGFLYQEASKIPLMISIPTVPGDKNDKFVYNMDIMPTILDCAGIETNNIDAKSLLPLIKKSKIKWHRDSIYLEFHGLRFLFSQRAVIDENGYKYIFTAGDFDEVYDLNTDPAEINNVIDDDKYVYIIKALKKKLMLQALEHKDPLVDYIYKIFGVWENPS